MPDYIYLMETRLTPDQQKAMSTVQEIARAHEMNIYLVGGAVRDLTSGFPIRDLDVAISGNVLKLQKDFEKSGATPFGVDEEFRTLHLLMPGNVRIEVSSTRSETFPKPGKPEIAFASIQEDLRRRDFSMNAMALSLNPGSRGLLLDPSNGMADIEAKVIRILHNYAFFEDPSRLVRATRLAARFHWSLEERTQARYDAAKENDYIAAISNRNIGYEIEQIAHEDDPVLVMKALEREGWMKVLYSAWNSTKVDTASLNELMKTRGQLADMGLSSEPSAAVMYFLTDHLPEKDISAMQRLLPRKGFVEAWRSLPDEAKDFSKKLLSKELNAPSDTWKFLMTSKPETTLFTSVTTKQQAVSLKIKNFLHKWPETKQKLPLVEMAEMRITPELPEYPKIMEEAFFLLLDGKLRSHTEIVKFLQPYSPPEPPPPPPARRGRGAKKADAAKTDKASAPVEGAEELPAQTKTKTKIKKEKGGKKGQPAEVKSGENSSPHPSPNGGAAPPVSAAVPVGSSPGKSKVAAAPAKAVAPKAPEAANSAKSSEAGRKTVAEASSKKPGKPAPPPPKKALAKKNGKPVKKPSKQK